MKEKIFNKISIILLCLLCLNTIVPIAAIKEEVEENPSEVYTSCLEEGMSVDARSASVLRASIPTKHSILPLETRLLT